MEKVPNELPLGLYLAIALYLGIPGRMIRRLLRRK
jgi:hypothetical protein